jgi:hypothetical protein
LVGVELLAAKPLLELLGVGRRTEAVHMPPLAVMVDGVPASVEREIGAKIMNLRVAAALAEPRRQDDLMWLVAINGRLRQLALLAHFQTAD